MFFRGGTGGNGIPKVGGIGGPGGNVIVEADSKVEFLIIINWDFVLLYYSSEQYYSFKLL